MSIDNDPVRIIVTGARGWDNWAVPKDALFAGMNLMRTARPRQAANGFTLVHGTSRGLDRIAASIATRQLGMTEERWPASWQTHTEKCPAWDRTNTTCRLAGFRRNAEMIAAGTDLVLGFPMHRMGTSGREASKGTWDAIKTADAAKATVYVIWNQQLFPFNQKAGRLLAATEKATHHMGQVDLSDLI